MGEQRWLKIKDILKGLLGVPEQVLDYVAVEEILKLCASGLSNETISRQLNMDEFYVEDVLDEFFEFDGWEVDLDVNPWFIYKKDVRNQSAFEYRVNTLTDLMDDLKMKEAYHVCSMYQRIREEIDKYYG